jgi:hypothetical protein
MGGSGLGTFHCGGAGYHLTVAGPPPMTSVLTASHTYTRTEFEMRLNEALTNYFPNDGSPKVSDGLRENIKTLIAEDRKILEEVVKSLMERLAILERTVAQNDKTANREASKQ